MGRPASSLGTALLILGSGCASAPASVATTATEMSPGDYRLTAVVRVRADTEHRERTQTLPMEAWLTVATTGEVTLSSDTGLCSEVAPLIDLTRSPRERIFDCGESSFAIEGRRGVPTGTVTRFVDDFLRHHTGCRLSEKRNGRSVCIEDAYTVVHRRVRKRAELNVRPTTRGPSESGS